MAAETILQHWIFTRFVLPFLLIFFIVFAILEKTKLLGGDKKQLNALLAFVIGLIFVSVSYPTEVASNLILFLTIGLIVLFVGLLLWGFAIGGEPKLDGTGLKWTAGIIIFVAVVIAVIWATGFDLGVFDWIFSQSWSASFWTNVAFIAAIAGAIAVVMKAK